MKRSLIIATLLALITIAAAAMVVLGASSPALLLVVVAVGAPATVFSFARAIVDPGRDLRVWPSLASGGLVVPMLVVTVGGAVSVAVLLLLTPFRELIADLFATVRADPALIDPFASATALILLIELAVVAPLVEETLKPLGSVWRRRSTRQAAFVYGMAAGCGFAVVENLLYSSLGYGTAGWLSIALARSAGAGLHILTAGLVALGWHEWRHRTATFASLAKLYGAAIGIHALWNGSIAVTIILFNSDHPIAGGSSPSALAWGLSLQVFLYAFGAVIVGALLVAAGSVARGGLTTSLVAQIRPGRPETLTMWAIATVSLMVPMAILLLGLPRFVAL